jgi:hypothetical protein
MIAVPRIAFVRNAEVALLLTCRSQRLDPLSAIFGITP